MNTCCCRTHKGYFTGGRPSHTWKNFVKPDWSNKYWWC